MILKVVRRRFGKKLLLHLLIMNITDCISKLCDVVFRYLALSDRNETWSQSKAELDEQMLKMHPFLFFCIAKRLFPFLKKKRDWGRALRYIGIHMHEE